MGNSSKKTEEKNSKITLDELEDIEELLDNLLDKEYKYFALPEYTRPATRHEAWFLCSAYCNLLMLKELRGLRKIFEELKEKVK